MSRCTYCGRFLTITKLTRCADCEKEYSRVKMNLSNKKLAQNEQSNNEDAKLFK